MQEIADYIDSYNANFKLNQLYRTGFLYLDTAYLRHMINKKDVFIEKLQPNVTKLEYANREIFISREIDSVYLFYIDENRNQLTIYVNDILYSSQNLSYLMSLGQLSKKGIDFKDIKNKMILYYLRKTVIIRVQIS